MIKYNLIYLPYSLVLVILSLLQHVLFVYSNPLNTPTIDLTSLQQMGLAGNYGGISIIKDDKQLTQIPVNTSSIIRYGNNQINTKEDNNIFELLASTSVNGTIYCSCQFNNGDIYFGGKFSSINHVPIYNIAKYNLQQQQITSLANGLDGPVYSLYCDPASNHVYVGGEFIAPKQPSPQYTAAMAYYGGNLAFWSSLSQSWSPFPFKGVNGPVYTIEKINNMFYFGGKFDMTADSQAYHAPSSQPINLQSPTTFSTSGSDENYSDPTEVVCSDGDSHPWLLQDNTRGYWQATFPYAIHVSLFRIANTHYNGRGTYEFGIFNVQQQSYFNLTYIDTKSGSLINCSLNCTLSDDSSIAYQDFLVVGSPNITSSVRIDIMSWYGLGGGLASVEIFQSEIFVHADSTGIFPTCSASEKNFNTPETKTVGKWTQATAQYSHYRTSTFPASQLKTTTNAITFTPYLPETGNYTVIMHTPGCKNNDNCNERTKVDLNIYFAPNTSPVTFTIDQATDNDKFDTIYTGFIQSTNTSNFSPYVTLSVSKQAKTPTKGNVFLVANYVQFIKSPSLNGLSSLLTYTPPTTNNSSMMTFYSNGTTNLPWKTLTDRLPYNSLVKAMVLDSNNNLYIGGQFKSGGNPLTNLSAYENIVQLDSKKNQLTSLPFAGLNGLISTLAYVNNNLFIGGTFNDFTMPLQKNQYISQNFIKYNIPTKGWGNLAGGVNGPVSSILLTSKNSLLVSGVYTGLFAPNNPNSVSNWTMSGNCWWDIDDNKWIPSLEQPFITGIVYDAFFPSTSSSSGKGNNTIISNWVYYMGSMTSAQRYASNGFVYLNNQTKPLIALSSPTIGGSSRMMITAGAFWNDPTHNNASSIILGGLIQLPNDNKNNNNNNNNLQNIVLYQNGQWKSILPSANSPLEMINDLMIVSNRLFIGGQFFLQQKLNAFAIYDLVNQTFVPVPDLHTADGSPTSVNAIKYSDTDNTVIVGGNFSTGGSLSCYGVCALDTTEYQWNNLGDGVMGNVTDFVFIDNKLMVAGKNLSLINGGVSGLAVSYDYGLNSWDTISSSDNTDNGLPGPCNTVSYDNVTKTTFFAGIQTNTSSAYLRMWNGQQFSLPNQDLGLGSYIEQLSVIPIMTNASLSSLPLTTSNLVGNNQSVLLATGLIILPNGNVSAALYNGTNWIPYIVASSMDGSPGLFKNVFFKSYNMSVHNTRYLPFPIVVLISIASALGIVFVLVLGSLFVLFIKRRQEAKVGDASAMNNNNPSTYYGKPPHRPESLLAMLNSPNAGTGLYALKKEMMEDRSINNDVSSSPTAFSNNDNNQHHHDHEFMAVATGAVAAGTMMEMKNISSTNNQSIQRPPEAHVNHPNAAFIGATTTTTLNDLNTHANSRNITSPPTSNINNSNNNNSSRNIRSSSHDSYNPFRQSYSSSLNLNVTDQSPITSSQQNEWNSNYNIGSAVTTTNAISNNGMNQNGGYVLGGATAINNGSGVTTAATATSNGISGIATTAAIAAVPFMNQQQQQQQQHQNYDNEIMKGGVRWTTAGMNDASFATVVPTTTTATTDSTIMNHQQNHHGLNNDNSVNRPLNIPSMHLGHIGNLTPDVAQWTTTTAPTSSSYMQGSSTTTTPSSLQPQTVEMRNLNATSAVTAAVMASSLASEGGNQNKNNNNIQSTTANGESVRWTQVGTPDSHALAKAFITKPTDSTIINENNQYDSSINNNNNNHLGNKNDSSIVYSSSPKEYNQQQQQQQGQPIQWTNYSTSDVKDTLQIKNVTTSMYSDYSFPSYSNQDITLPGISSDFASDPDFAKWTTATSDDNNNDVSKEKEIQQNQQSINNNKYNNNDDVNNNYNNINNYSSSSAVPTSSSSYSNMHSSSSQQASTLPSSPSSTSISSKSARQPTYTSNLRYSSVILPDDMVPIAPSPRSSISSTVSNYQDHSINNNKDMEKQHSQVNKLKDVEADKGFSFRWSDIVDSEMNDDPPSSQQHPLTTNITTTIDNESSSSSTTKPDQQGKDSKWATTTTNALLSTGMEQTKSGGNGGSINKNPLDGRAASKKMVQDYFSSRENSGGTTTQPTAKTMDENKRAKYKSDFRLAMKQAFGNNSNNGNEGCSEDKPYLYIAKFDFSAREHGELGFEKGDPIIVIDAEDDIWWMGFKDSKNVDEGPQQGVFPSNYVERATTLPY